MRDASAKTLIVGWRSMNPLTAEDTTIITATDATMAAIITSMCFDSPMAVNTESRENTMSMTPICKMIIQKPFSPLGRRLACLPLSMARISMGLFTTRKSPPQNKIRSRPEISLPSTVNRVARNVAIQVIENSSAMRVNIAKLKPRIRALARRALGRRSTKIARKMMLSMPRTISSTASVRKDSQTCGSESSSMLGQAVDLFGLRQLALQQIVGPQAKVQGQRRGNIDRRVGAGENTDHQRGGKRVQCF